ALKIRVASKESQPIAAILTLQFKDTLMYKYGCSDARFHSAGGMHLLFWRSIVEAKRACLRTFDLGRSDWEDTGLILFKDRWGARRSALTYTRLAADANSKSAFVTREADWKVRMARRMMPCIPDRILSSAGSLISRHVG